MMVLVRMFRVLEHLKACADLHTALKPYLKRCEEELINDALPVMRPLFYHYDEEEAYTIKDEYLLGQDLLIAPVTEEGASLRKVWLPKDEWTDFWTGKQYTGGSYIVDAPLGRIPVFVRTKALPEDLSYPLKSVLESLSAVTD